MGKNIAPDPRELLRKHNQMKEDSRIQYYSDNKMTVTSIKPEWLRREICEAIGRGETITISIGNGHEFPIQLIESAPTVYEGEWVWVDPMQVPLSCKQKDLFLAYIPGWNVCISYWRTGSGWRRFNDNETIHPELVAKINLPKW